MRLLSSFKPTKGKILFGFIVTIVWYIFLFSLSTRFSCTTCLLPIKSNCSNEWPRILATCDCCFTFSDFILQLVVIFTPFAAVYLIYSIYQNILKL